MDDAAANNDNTGEEAPRDDGVNMDIDGNLGLADGAEEDDADDESFKSEDIPSDDNSTGDDDELEYDSDYDVEMRPRGYTLNVTEAALGEESKALLIWREDDDKSFSDWKIKVVAEGEDEGNENATVYSVHRSVLALGPKKSDYFEALFNFNESSSDCMTTVKLSEEVAAHFPHFLDYMYSQPLESKAIVSFANWKSMAHFANYFIVPRLTEDVLDFIRKDMYTLDHMEAYLSECDGTHDDVSNGILHQAAGVFTEMIQSIQVDSPLLKFIPPIMFYDIMSTLVHSGAFRSASDEDRDHVHGLVIGHLESNGDKSGFNHLSRLMSGAFFDYDDVEIAGNRALDWFRLMKHKGWKRSCLTVVCTHFLRKYLCSQQPTLALMNRVVKEVPDKIVANLFRESLLWRRTAEFHQRTGALRFDITVIKECGKRLRVGKFELPKAASTEAISALKARLADGFCSVTVARQHMMLSHNGVRMDDEEPISTYPISQEENLIEVWWMVYTT
eukprot:scaffold9897_cov71-Skeletonema_dohrnii-CCMP3373.AAC.2